jgi:hypothetical protein
VLRHRIVLDYNARVAQNEAQRTEMEARERARRMREENERALGAQRGAYAKSGVTSAGSPLMVMAETAGLGELAVADEAPPVPAEPLGSLLGGVPLPSDEVEVIVTYDGRTPMYTQSARQPTPRIISGLRRFLGARPGGVRR